MESTHKLVREIVEHYRSNPALLRRQGPTFLQLEIDDYWLHFWGDAHSKAPTMIAAQAHTHHRDFSSIIVHGAINNRIIKMTETEPEKAQFAEYLLVGGSAMSASTCEPTGKFLTSDHEATMRYERGQMYDMVADSWHETLFTEQSITLLQLKGPVVPRYIAWPAKTPPEKATLKWVGIRHEDALHRIDGLLEMAGIK